MSKDKKIHIDRRMVSDDNVSSEDSDDECIMELPVYMNCSEEASDQLHMF